MYCSSATSRIKSLKVLFIGFLFFLVVIPIFLWNNSLFSAYMDVLTPIMSLLASSLVLFAVFWSYKKKSETFKPWLVMSVALVLYSIASFFYFVFMDTQIFYSFSISDIIYIIAYALVMAGIFLFMKKPFKIKYRGLLDATIIMVSVFFIVWFMFIWSTVEPSQPDTVSVIMSISYLFLDLMVLATVLTLLFNENRKIPELPVVLFALGMFFQILGDMLYAYYVVDPILIYKWLFTVFYTSNSVFVIMAVLVFLSNVRLKGRFTLDYYRKLFAQNVLISYLPLILVLFTYALLIITTPDAALIWGVGVVVVLVIIRQITSLNEIKQNKLQISKRNEQLSFITSNMLDLITESDKNGVIKYASPSSSHVLGHSPEYLLGKSAYDFINPDYRAEIRERLDEAVASRSSVILLYCSKNAEGKNIWLESMGKPVFENNKFKGFIYSSRDVTERIKSEELIKKSLREKEIMLNEIHHRVNNNLQMIISLLNLQAGNVVNEKDQELFMESQSQVQTLAMVHEKLYQSDNLSSINFSDYLKTLLNSLMYNYSQNFDNIDLDLDIDEIEFNIETSIPCGLIINELVSNSLKHAFTDDKRGKIIVKLHKQNEEYVLVVGDNGRGVSEKLNMNNTTLGLNLVYSLVKQLDGTIERINCQGTVYKIKFKELEYEERI